MGSHTELIVTTAARGAKNPINRRLWLDPNKTSRNGPV